MKTLRRFGSLVVLVLACASCSTPKASQYGEGPNITVAGEGASFPDPLYKQWIASYRSVDPKASVTYSPKDSSAGIAFARQTKATRDTIGFGATDTPDDDKKDADRFVQIPTTVGAIVVVYNLPKVAPGAHVTLSADVLAAIYRGQIVSWDDKRIKDLNPALSLEPMPIRVAYRGDSSGSTYVFSQYLSTGRSGIAAASTFATAPPGVAATGTSMIVKHVRSTAGAIGYIDLASARKASFSVAALVNADRRAVLPSLETIAAAVGAEPRFSLTDPVANAKGPESYPIVQMTYVLLPRAVSDRESGLALARFMWWATHEGQKLAPSLGYVPLPPELVLRVETALRTMTAAGQPAIPAS